MYCLPAGLVLLIFHVSLKVQAQYVYDCPNGWYEQGISCYHFVFYPGRTFKQASVACQVDGAYLLSVSSLAENEFISDWLTRHDQNRANQWWTSGVGQGETMMWQGENSSVISRPELWQDASFQDTQRGQYIVYLFDPIEGRFKWGRQTPGVELPYICEIKRAESYRVLQMDRDHHFGTNYTDPNEVPRGPRFIKQPSSLVVVEDTQETFLECTAQSNPAPSYKWYFLHNSKDSGSDISSNNATQLLLPGDHFTITNGKFLLHRPREERDVGTYQCEALNGLGSILSDPVRISYGYLQEFSNVTPRPVTARQYQGTMISCRAPVHNPALQIQWYKEDAGPNYLRTDLHPHLFVSKNGKLYISETSPMDAGFYHCSVMLIAPLGQDMATDQPPSRLSMGIQLIITGDSALDYGPIIHNDFPLVTPSPSLRGNTLTLECFAYGKLPLHYSWTKDGGGVPEKASLAEHGRWLILPDAQLDDSGNYTCYVTRGGASRDVRNLQLVVEAAPFFIFPLRDQHVDIGRRLSWRCEAMGRPDPVYRWFKNAKPLVSIRDDLTIDGNVLTIMRAQPGKHDGMYQCSATNVYGTRFSSAQLRVLEFAPSFAKHPLNPSQFGTVGGNVTILCQPEAAPAPTYSWRKDDRTYPVSTDPLSRVFQLANGNLVIRNIQLSDQGKYTCVSTNSLGQASSDGVLRVVSRPVITVSPHDTQVDVNGTAFLPCQASFPDTQRDLVYAWAINGLPINYMRDSSYRTDTRAGFSGLYVIGAQLRHTGLYTCTATTVDYSSSYSGHLQVRGPPGECAGVYGYVHERTVTLYWTPGPEHGATISTFSVFFNTDFNSTWRVLAQGVPMSEVAMEIKDIKNTRRCRMETPDLKPGSSYRFRVAAFNVYGAGPPSLPSTFYKIPDAPPVATVTGIREGISAVGSLPIVWDPLDMEDLTGDDVGYRVYYRKQTRTEGKWSVDDVQGYVNSHVPFVGADNYFLPYEIMIAPFNSLGHGPNSTVEVIMSAEDMPIAAATGVYAESINATAILVRWDPIPNTRQYIRGRVQGYQINYWLFSDPNKEMGGTNIYCDCGHGMVIGLDPNEDYWINIQVFTKAGLGPLSEDGFGSTYIFPALHYPKYVHVSSYRGNAVFVSWQGVSTGLLEETVVGFKMRWWPATEDIRTANDTMIQGRTRTFGVIHGVQSGTVYALRVLAYSAGGDGKKSPTVYFTLEGQVIINVETTEIMNSAPGRTHQGILWLNLTICYLIFVFVVSVSGTSVTLR